MEDLEFCTVDAGVFALLESTLEFYLGEDTSIFGLDAGVGWWKAAEFTE